MTSNQAPSNGIHHFAPIASVAITPSGHVLTVSYDGALCEWELRSPDGLVGISRRILHSKGVNCVAVDPTGRYAATCGSDGHACLVDLQDTSASVKVLHHPGDVETGVFSADGRYLLTGGTDGTARIFDTQSFAELTVIPHGKTVGASSRHPDDAFAVTGCNDTGVRKIEWSTGRVVEETHPHTGPVKAIIPTQHGLITSGHDGKVLQLDDRLNVLALIRAYSTTPKSMAVEPDGHHFWIAAYDQTITRWKSAPASVRQSDAANIPVSELYDARAWPHGVAATENVVVIGSFDGVPRCYRLAEGTGYEPVPAPHAPVPCISSMALDSAAGYLILGGDSGAIRKVGTASLVSDQRSTASEWVASAPSAITGVRGQLDDVLYGAWDGTLARITNGEPRWTASWPLEGAVALHSDSPIVGIAQSDNHVVAALYTGGTACFDADSGKHLWSQTEATGAIKSVSVTPKLFAMTGRYDPLRVGSLETGQVLGRLPLNTPVSDYVAFCPDASRLAVCADDFQVWIVDVAESDSASELLLTVIHRGDGHTAPVKAIAWLDPTTVVSGCYNGHVYLHRIGQPSIRISQIDSRLGVSALAVDRDRIYWSTFDGYVGYVPRESLATG